MRLPFTPAQFFGVFQEYNSAVWPAQLLLNLVAVAMLAAIFAWPRRSGRIVALGLTAFWAWLAVIYHLIFFWKINPAAPWFAGVSLLAALMFGWSGVYRGGIRFDSGLDARKIVGICFAVYALFIYPVIGLLLGHRLSDSPSFGLPCPTTLYTFGILMMAARPVPRPVVVLPLLWAAVGGTAAFSLGVTQDYALFAALAAGVWLLAFNHGK